MDRYSELLLSSSFIYSAVVVVIIGKRIKLNLSKHNFMQMKSGSLKFRPIILTFPKTPRRPILLILLIQRR